MAEVANFEQITQIRRTYLVAVNNPRLSELLGPLRNVQLDLETDEHLLTVLANKLNLAAAQH